MQNLLTVDYKKNIRRLYRARVFTVVLFMVSIVSLVSLVLLSTIYFILYITSSVTINQISLLNKNEKKDNVKSEYDSFFKNLAVLPVSQQEFGFSDIFDRILAKKEEGVILREISFSKRGEKNDNGTVVLRGVAKNRSALVSFTEALRNESLFSSVDSPISNLLKEQNLDFSLTITLKNTGSNEKKS